MVRQPAGAVAVSRNGSGGNIAPPSALSSGNRAAIPKRGRNDRERAIMSYIPSHAMPHAYVHEDEETSPERKPPSALMIAGGALLGLLLYKALR